MTKRDRGQAESDEPTRITVKDNRRIDPATGEVREQTTGMTADAAPGDAAAAASPAGADSGPAGAAEADAVAAARAETAERTADLQRITAEYANYRKRADRDKQAAAASGKASVVADLLAVLDDVDRADEHGDLTGGFKTVADKLRETLGKQGLTHYGAEGDEFDPNVHEAVQFVTSAEVDRPTVTMVLRRGYLIEEKVLRPAVVVVTGPEHESEPAPAGSSSAGESQPTGEATEAEAQQADDAAGTPGDVDGE